MVCFPLWTSAEVGEKISLGLQCSACPGPDHLRKNVGSRREDRNLLLKITVISEILCDNVLMLALKVVASKQNPL